jgi:fused signal recognition particle receptor
MFKISLKKKISRILGSKKNREEIFKELEELLILSDISADRVERLLKQVKKRIKLTFEKDDFIDVLKEEFKNLFAEARAKRGEDSSSAIQFPDAKNVVLIVGVNGSGKTTTAAKLALFYRQKGLKILLCAADTFRAAGSSQLVPVRWCITV